MTKRWVRSDSLLDLEDPARRSAEDYGLSDVRGDLRFIFSPVRALRALPRHPNGGVDWRVAFRAMWTYTFLPCRSFQSYMWGGILCALLSTLGISIVGIIGLKRPGFRDCSAYGVAGSRAGVVSR